MTLKIKMLLTLRRKINCQLDKELETLINDKKPCDCDNPLFADFIRWNDLTDDWYLMWACIYCGGYK